MERIEATNRMIQDKLLDVFYCEFCCKNSVSESSITLHTSSGPLSGTYQIGVDSVTEQLLTIDSTTGAATAVGPRGFIAASGLAFNPGTNTLFGIDIGTDKLLTINTTTVAGTAVGPLGFGGVLGLVAFSVSVAAPSPPSLVLVRLGLLALVVAVGSRR